MPLLITPSRARQIMQAYRPRGWRIKMGGVHQRGASGLCDFGERAIYVPTVCDDYSLLVYLHEVAHARLHRTTTKPGHIMEYEAEMWACKALRDCGFRVSREIVRSAKRNVADHIVRDRVQGLPINAKIARWATRKSRAR
jgi:hypothetical protein